MGIFNEALHPRGKGAQGGQFVSKGADGQTVRTNQIGYNAGSGKGTGYSIKGGDRNVKALQQELNRLGIVDGQGNQLKVDGKFGPKTTAAVRRLQARLGLHPDGKVTPQLLNRLRKLKPTAHDQHAMHVRHMKAVAGKKAAHPVKKAAHPVKKAMPAKKTSSSVKVAAPGGYLHTTPAGKRRGRPPGSKNKPKSGAVSSQTLKNLG